MAQFEKPQVYGNGKNSTIGEQTIDKYVRKAIMEDEQERVFSNLGSAFNMPKHSGKSIVQQKYVPEIDDRNINDQGIDTAGQTTSKSITYKIITPNNQYEHLIVGEGTDSSKATKKVKLEFINKARELNLTTQDANEANYAQAKTDVEGKGWHVEEGKEVPIYGNLYASSRDIGTVTGKLPSISEEGGRVNRVGFKRVTTKGTFQQYGKFFEYTKDALDFDSDDQLYNHYIREAMIGARKVIEDTTQIDLLNNSGITFYGGTATSIETVTGEGATPSKITYDLLHKLKRTLDNNNVPTDTSMITGTNRIDTKTIQSARYIFIHPDLEKSLLKLKNFNGENAFVSVEKYAAGATNSLIKGEIGSIDGFRFVKVPHMMFHSGKGAKATTGKDTYYNTGVANDGTYNYNVYPMLFVGDDAFTTVGFQSTGATNKFDVKHAKPTADRFDPYGHVGVWSIQWWYGFLAQRPERIATIWVVAEK